MIRALATLVCVALLAAAGGAGAWERRLVGVGEAKALALDANGDVVAVGQTYDSASHFWDFMAVRVWGGTGKEHWQHALWGDGGAGCCGTTEDGRAVAIGPLGQVFVGGYLHFDGGTAQDLTTARLNPSSGSELWRRVYTLGRAYYSLSDSAFALAVDAAGNPVVAGRFVLSGAPDDSRFVVAKLDVTTGTPVWTREIGSGAPINEALAVAVDGAGDVLAAGTVYGQFYVTKLAGASGATLWEHFADGALAGVARSVAVDPAGDVLAGGQYATQAMVTRLEAATGNTVWQREIASTGYGDIAEIVRSPVGDVLGIGWIDSDDDLVNHVLGVRLASASGADVWPPLLVTGSGTQSSYGTSLALDANGDVALAGRISNASTNVDLLLMKIDGDTRAELWRREIDAAGNDTANDVAVDAAGDVIAAGTLGVGFSVLKLRGSDGADFPICGDVDGDLDVDSADWLALRQVLAGISPALPVPAKCSVIGGASDCDVLDSAVIRRSLSNLAPGVAGVCAAVFE